MKNKLSLFQIILYGFLIFIIIAGVIVFALQRSQESQSTKPITAWGTIPSEIISTITEFINDQEKNTIKMNYVEFTEDEFEGQFVEALASGTGPDILFLDNDTIIRHQNKLYEIDYDFYSQKTYKNTFIEAGDILLKEESLLGFPFIVDPLVLYWNRTSLNAAGISVTPKYWDQVLQITPSLVKKDNDFNIEKAAVSFGETRNVDHAEEILLTLINQSGNPIIVRNDEEENTNFSVVLDERLGYSVNPAEAALNYFVQFSNPSLNSYSWNRSLPSSKEMFLAGDLVFYIGYASEFRELRERNPNLNFDVAVLPQSRSNEDNVSVLGEMIFMGIPKNSQNISPAFSSMNTLIQPNVLSELSNYTNLPPVRRDLLTEQNNNAIMQTFYDAAIITKPFLDPNPDLTRDVLREMVETYTSGKTTASQSILRARKQLEEYVN